MTSLLQKITNLDTKVDGLDSSNLQTQITTNTNDISGIQTNKQNKLTAGDNISIVGDTISSTTDISCNTLTTTGNASIGGTLTIAGETLDNKLSGKQDKLENTSNLNIKSLNVLSNYDGGVPEIDGQIACDTLVAVSDVRVNGKLDRKQSVVCKSNPTLYELTFATTSFTLTTTQDTHSVDFVSETSGIFTFLKAGLYKVSGHMGIRSRGYNARIMVRLTPFLNNAYQSNFPIGYGYIRGSSLTVSRCSCDLSFMLNVNLNDTISFVMEQAKDDLGTFGAAATNTNVEVQSVMFEYLGT